MDGFGPIFVSVCSLAIGITTPDAISFFYTFKYMLRFIMVTNTLIHSCGWIFICIIKPWLVTWSEERIPTHYIFS